MIINPHASFLRDYCHQHGLIYVAMVNHNNEIPLYLWSNKHSQYIEISFNIRNLSEVQVKSIIDNYIQTNSF